jgi:hypothetical protein
VLAEGAQPATASAAATINCFRKCLCGERVGNVCWTSVVSVDTAPEELLGQMSDRNDHFRPLRLRPESSSSALYLIQGLDNLGIIKDPGMTLTLLACRGGRMFEGHEELGTRCGGQFPDVDKGP